MPLALTLAHLLVGGARVAATNIDLSELALVGADADYNVNLTEPALAALGWKRGLVITFSLYAGSSDQVGVYEKNGHCLVAFQGVNDEHDYLSILGGLGPDPGPVDMCRLKVNSGIAQEMQSFLQTPELGRMVEYLNDETKCSDVTAVGHSMGGSLATLWATCANQGNNTAVFGERRNYGLVTFGALAMSTTPAFNGEPGKPFVGTRYCLTEKDGGTNEQSSFHVDTKEFRLELLDLYSKMAAAIGNSDLSTQLGGLKSQLSSRTSAQIESMWYADVLRAGWAQPLGLLTFAKANEDSDLGNTIRAAIPKWTASGVLSFQSDPVCSIGQVNGFLHAVQPFQPMPNKLLSKKALDSMEKVPSSDADVVKLPKADLFQLLFSTLANGGTFVNHAMCCYAMGGNEQCSEKYTTPEWRSCQNPLAAYLPQPTTTTTTTNTGLRQTTCGHIKSAYRKQGCCGNPNKLFPIDPYDRRLQTVLAEPENEEDFMKMIDAAMENAKTKGGQQDVGKLANHILESTREYAV